MAQVGKYELIDDLFLTEYGSVSRARRVDGEPGEFVVKRFAMPVDDPSEPQWERQIFLDRAKIQQQIVAAGAKCWAPIRDLGMEGDHAYYVTDYHPISIAKLIESRVSPTAVGLYAVVRSIVQGLTELQSLRNRAHGNLKPGNVLIAGRDLAAAHVLLADPATNAQAAKVGEVGDLKSLGELIHQLITHEPSAQWPLPTAPAWNSLGRHGEPWRKLCNDLLNPDPAGRPRLWSVGRRIDALKPRKKLPVRKILVAMATPVVLAATAVTIFSVMDHSARDTYCQAKRDWFGKFLADASDPARQKRWQADADLQQLLNDLPLTQLAKVDCDSSRLIRYSIHDYTAVGDANAAVQRVGQTFPTHWGKATKADELRHRFQDRGWEQPADYLAKLIDATRPGPGADVAGAVDRLIVISPQIGSAITLADSEWKEFSDRLSSIEASNDPVLNSLAALLRKSAASEVHLGDAGFTGFADVRQDSALAGKLVDAIHSTWPTNVDREHFDHDIAKAIDLKHVQKDDVGKWLAAVSANAYQRTEARVAAADLRKRLDETVDLINHAHVSDDEAKAFDADRQKAVVAIHTLELTAFTHQNLTDGTFVRQRDQTQNLVEGLRRYYHPVGPEQWLDALPAVATASGHINNYWEAWRNVLRDALPEMTRDHKVFAERQQASEQLRSLLVSLDQGFPPAPPMSNANFIAAAHLRRERDLGKILPSIDLRSPKIDPDVLKAAQDSFLAWSADLVALNRDFPITREILGPNDRFDVRWKLKPKFWNDPIIVNLVKEDVARLDRIAALDSASRETLISTMNGSGPAEVALAAWRQVGAPGVQPPWPTRGDELSQEYRFRQRLLTSLKSLKDPTEADEPTAELAQTAPVRWRRFAENATSEAMLAVAWNLRKQFGIDEQRLAALGAITRYNLALSRLHQSEAANDDDAVRNSLAALSAVSAELKDRPEVARLKAQIARIPAKEAFADQNPGDVFRVALPGQRQQVEFKRVEPTAGRPFYLCTTEVSVAQFAAAMDATNGWSQGRLLAWPYYAGKVDGRRGPRSWEWSGSDGPAIAAPLLWLTPADDNDYAPSLLAGKFNHQGLSKAAGDNPSPDHPMQYVSGQGALFYAGLCGCRLPTPAEWQSAYVAYEKSVPMERWNLRDQTWAIQQAYVAKQGGTRWPDEGIFPATALGAGPAPALRPGTSAAFSAGPSGNRAAIGSGAIARPANDGTLFFQTVAAPDGNVFHHLVGNVGEFLCDAADRYDAWEDKKTADGVQKFLKQAPSSLYVIGGSALSPPEVPVDKPLPVARAEDAYADVGLRLAFTAPSRSLAEKVRWAIGDPPFIWPAKVAGVAGAK